MAKSNMTNINSNATSKFWYNIFVPTNSYSAQVQHYLMLNSNLADIMFFKNRSTSVQYLKYKNIDMYSYSHITLEKKKNLMRNLTLRVFNLKVFHVGTTTCMETNVFNPSVFFLNPKSLKHRVVNLQRLAVRDNQLVYLAKSLNSVQPIMTL